MAGPYYSTTVTEYESSLTPNYDIIAKALFPGNSDAGSGAPEPGNNKSPQLPPGIELAGPPKPLTTTEKVGQIFDELKSMPNTDPYIRLKAKSIIDVRRDFAWTVSPKQYVLDKIPSLILEEREQIMGSLISSALYYLGSFNNTLAAADALSLIDDLTSKLTGWAQKQSAIPDFVSDGAAALNGVGSKLGNVLLGLADVAEKINSSSNDKAILGDKLKSYIGLYYTQPTGFKYVLPYFEDAFIKSGNSWKQGGESENFITKAISKVQGRVESLVSLGNILTPGTYIEKPRFYEYGGESQSITVNFPLLNTHFETANRIPYIQNYEFLWILAYQNKPFKTSFSRILPPKLYSVYLPGVAYMPYAYISDLTVNFIGNRRLLPVTLPTGVVVNAPIPEAYDVSITIKSLISDVGNTMVDQFFTANTVEVLEQSLINNPTETQPTIRTPAGSQPTIRSPEETQKNINKSMTKSVYTASGEGYKYTKTVTTTKTSS